MHLKGMKEQSAIHIERNEEKMQTRVISLQEPLSVSSLPLSGQPLSLAVSLSQSIHLSPCLPVNVKQRRTEKETPEGVGRVTHLGLSFLPSTFLYPLHPHFPSASLTYNAWQFFAFCAIHPATSPVEVIQN